MSNHSDKIYNGLCVECLSNYSKVLNEKQSEINKLVEEMRNLTFPHLEVTMIPRDEVPKLQVENTRDDLLNNIFINKSLKEDLKEEISNVIAPKKIGRPKKVKIEDESKWNKKKVDDANKVLREQSRLPNKDFKVLNEAKKVLKEQEILARKELQEEGRIFQEQNKNNEVYQKYNSESEKNKRKEQIRLKKEKVVILDLPLYPKRTRGRGKSLKTLEKEKALKEAQNNVK